MKPLRPTQPWRKVHQSAMPWLGGPCAPPSQEDKRCHQDLTYCARPVMAGLSEAETQRKTPNWKTKPAGLGLPTLLQTGILGLEHS